MSPSIRETHGIVDGISVVEEFALEDSKRIAKRLSINGTEGRSNLSIREAVPLEASQEVLKLAWDKAFLTQQIEYPEPDDDARAIRVADVFCGAGGMSYGVCEAIRSIGMRASHVLAVDVDPVALEVHRRNFDPEYYSTENLWGSVTNQYSAVDSESGIRFLEEPRLLSDQLRTCVDKVDILLGSPPCEGHSSSNNATRRSDPRNMYYAVMPALAVALNAKVVVIENVPGIEHDRRQILNHAKGLFTAGHYLVDERIINAVEVGLPQTRKRHVLIASRTRKPDIDTVIQALARNETDLRWAIEDLASIESDDPIDASGELSIENRRRIDHLFDNDEYDLVDYMRPGSHRNGHTYPSIYGRLHWDMPSGTITTGFNTPGRGRYIHPSQRRTLTAHEAARIQGFPDSFSFKTIDGSYLTRHHISNFIGNAVPPQLGYAAGVAALAALDI